MRNCKPRNFTLTDEAIEALDRLRGMTSRSAYISKLLIEEEVRNKNEQILFDAFKKLCEQKPEEIKKHLKEGIALGESVNLD